MGVLMVGCLAFSSTHLSRVRQLQRLDVEVEPGLQLLHICWDGSHQNRTCGQGVGQVKALLIGNFNV